MKLHFGCKFLSKAVHDCELLLESLYEFSILDDN